MQKISTGIFIALFALVAFVRPAAAQTENGATGEVLGKIINQNNGREIAETLDVMLHVLDQNYADQGMLHGQSQTDGSFVFTDVAFDASLQYTVMAIYENVTYFSEVVPADMDSLQAFVNVPVYESTSDLSTVQVDQMHVLFDFAPDGLETKEIYVFSNSGEQTVKEVYDLGEGSFATLKFPLPSDADFIFFKPDDQDRFVRLGDGFADTYPILPGTDASQIMVSYLVPYSGKRTYTYTAPVNIARANFLVPDEAGISLKGTGLTGPESMDLQTGKSYLVYSYSGLSAGQTVNISLSGRLGNTASPSNINTAIAVGAVFLGFAVIGVGIWWWRRPDDTNEETGERPDAGTALDQIINEIAHLDQAHEDGEIDERTYRQSRDVLRTQASALLEESDKAE